MNLATVRFPGIIDVVRKAIKDKDAETAAAAAAAKK
jgi:hypothetical protein